MKQESRCLPAPISPAISLSHFTPCFFSDQVPCAASASTRHQALHCILSPGRRLGPYTLIMWPGFPTVNLAASGAKLLRPQKHLQAQSLSKDNPCIQQLA